MGHPPNTLTTSHNTITKPHNISQHPHKTITTASQHPQNTLTTPSQHPHNTLTIPSQHPHSTLTTHSQHPHNISQHLTTSQISLKTPSQQPQPKYSVIFCIRFSLNSSSSIV